MGVTIANAGDFEDEKLPRGERIDNTEQFKVVLNYQRGSTISKETHYFSSQGRAEGFARDVWQAANKGNAFLTLETITLYYAGIPWQSWNVIEKE